MDTGINAASRLAALPEELLSNVAVRLGPDDVFALRLSCRAIEAKTLHEFALEYFTAKGFIFSTESLKVLLNIATSAKLARYLTQLYLLPARFSELRSDCYNSNVCGCTQTLRQREAWADYCQDQDYLRKHATDKSFLVRALSRLPSLQTLSLVDTPSALPPNVEWRGQHKIHRTTKSSPAFSPRERRSKEKDAYFTWLGHVFRTMLIAVADSAITSITRLEAKFSREPSLALSPFDLTLPMGTVGKLSHCFAQLNEVDLVFRTRTLRRGTQDSPNTDAKAARLLSIFAKTLTAATKVKLAFDELPATGSFFTAVTNRMHLHKLTNFALEGLAIDITSLASIVCQLSSVSQLSILGVELTDGSWIPILHALMKLPALNHLHLIYPRLGGEKVFFLKRNRLRRANHQLLGGDLTGEDGYAPEDISGEPPPLLGANFIALPTVAVAQEVAEDLTQSQKPLSASTAVRTTHCTSYTGPDYRLPNAPARSPERGYYVCLEGDEIHKQLPVFMKEYNVGGEAPEGYYPFGQLFPHPFPPAPALGHNTAQVGGGNPPPGPPPTNPAGGASISTLFANSHYPLLHSLLAGPPAFQFATGNAGVHQLAAVGLPTSMGVTLSPAPPPANPGQTAPATTNTMVAPQVNQPQVASGPVGTIPLPPPAPTNPPPGPQLFSDPGGAGTSNGSVPSSATVASWTPFSLSGVPEPHDSTMQGGGVPVTSHHSYENSAPSWSAWGPNVALPEEHDDNAWMQESDEEDLDLD